MDPLTALFWGGTALKTVSSFMPKTTRTYGQTVYNDGTKYGGYRGAGHGTISESRLMHVKEDTDLAKRMNIAGEAASLIGGLGMASKGVEAAATTAATPGAEGGFSLWGNIGQGMGTSLNVPRLGSSMEAVYGKMPEIPPQSSDTKDVTSNPYGKPIKRNDFIGTIEPILDQYGPEILGDRYTSKAKQNIIAHMQTELGEEGWMARYNNFGGIMYTGKNADAYFKAKDYGDKPGTKRQYAAWPDRESGIKAMLSLYKNDRYKNIDFNANARSFGEQLHRSGWAEDPNYPGNMESVYNSLYPTNGIQTTSSLINEFNIGNIGR